MTCIAIILSGQSTRSNKAPKQSPTISIDVNRVPLYVTVQGSRSELIGDLTKENFTVKEDGHTQEVTEFQREDLPVAIGLVLDNSESMLNKRDEVIAAAMAFIAHSNPEDQIFVVHFANRINFGLPKNLPFSSSPVELENALRRLTPNGTTALYDAIYAGLNHLNTSDLTKKALVVITDGGDNASVRKLDEVAKQANLSGALFYAIGIYDTTDADADPGALRRLARETGGEAFFPEDISQISQVCELIARDLKNQYLLVYAPPARSKGGAYHRVQVSVRDPKRRKLTVRTRTGYFDETGK